jgi:hypothetical protein
MPPLEDIEENDKSEAKQDDGIEEIDEDNNNNHNDDDKKDPFNKLDFKTRAQLMEDI